MLHIVAVQGQSRYDTLLMVDGLSSPLTGEYIYTTLHPYSSVSPH